MAKDKNMMGKKISFNVFKQKPKPSKKPYKGIISVLNKVMNVIENEGNGNIVAELRNPEIIHANSYGMGFRGFEPNGVDVHQTEKYIYQEWWCVFDRQK